MQILDGKSYSKLVKNEVKKKIEEENLSLKLAVLLVGDNEASSIYVRNKEKAAHLLGIDFELWKYPADVKEEVLIQKIEEFNQREDVTSIMVQLPLPAHICERKVLDSILYTKDADGLTTYNMGALALGTEGIISCTPKGILKLLKYYEISLEGKNVVVVGRSNIVGKPISFLMLKENATVTICHSKTKNLEDYTKMADILIVAVGKSKMIGKKHLKDGAIVIDVGINRENGILTGDVDFEEVKDMVQFITPVPGGVGPMTVAMLMENVLECYQLQKKI